MSEFFMIFIASYHFFFLQTLVTGDNLHAFVSYLIIVPLLLAM